MQRIVKLFTMAVMAACAFTAITVASASAFETTKILPEPTAKEPLETTGTQVGAGDLLTTGGFEVKCTAGSGKETYTTANNGSGNVTFTTCTGPLSTVCSSGATSGEIKAEGESRFWLALLMLKPSGSELIAALVFLNKEVKFTCENAKKTVIDKVVVKAGCEAAQVASGSLNKLVKQATVLFTEFESGETAVLSVLPEGKTVESPCLPITTVNGGAEELSALTANIVFGSYSLKGKTEIELMK